ncbi:MAG: N-acetylneuraminate synthase family protein, partial [Bdellovibrionales bacterium]|nr:N-acetylneuraminate synthase family protein [Bdellovibrionales bacterium]
MIIEIQPDAREADVRQLFEELQQLGLKQTEVKTQLARYVVALGSDDIDLRLVGRLPAVRDVFRVSESYKLVSRKWKLDPSRIEFPNGAVIGGGGLSIIAGPCSVESREQLERISGHLKEEGILMMRGGAFKPRTSPYSFRGLGIEGLKLFHEVASASGLMVVSEVMRVSQIEQMYDYVDVYQVGARNTQNFSLLHELGNVDKPVLLKRGISGTIDELLQSAEYIFANGNEKLILCER